MVQAQQKRIDEVMEKSKKLIMTTATGQSHRGQLGNTKNYPPQKKEKNKRWCRHCQCWVYHRKETYMVLERKNDNDHSGASTRWREKPKHEGLSKGDRWGVRH